jgi:hypothetical protein
MTNRTSSTATGPSSVASGSGAASVGIFALAVLCVPMVLLLYATGAFDRSGGSESDMRRGSPAVASGAAAHHSVNDAAPQEKKQ